MRNKHGRIAGWVCCLLACGVSSAWAAGVHVRLESSKPQPSPGDTVIVSLNLFQADAEINAFDVFLQFDPARLAFVAQTPINLQIGPVMAANCSNFFHLFTPYTDHLEGHLSMLCQNTYATGPGVIYQVKFRALAVSGPTSVTWQEGTEFYRAGFFVRPAELVPLTLQVGGVNSVGPREGRVARFSIGAPSPNPSPSSDRVSFDYSVPARERVEFEIYDSQGRRVAARIEADAEAGRHRFTWEGLRLAPGLYLVRMSSATGAHAECGWVVLR